MRRFIATTVAVSLLAIAGDAAAKLSPSQKEELAGYAEKLAEVQDPEAQQGTLLLRGLIASSKERKEIAALESSEDARTRLTAKLALVLAGDRKAAATAADEIEQQGGTYGLLRSGTAPMPDDDEVKVIKELLDGAKPPVAKDVYRYLAEQRGDLFELALDALESSDDQKRALAARALVDAGRADVLERTEKLLDAKDENVRREAVQLVLAFSKLPAHLTDARAQLRKAANDASPKIKEAAARRLVELNDKGAAKTLIEIAKAEEKPAGAAAVLGFLVENDAKVAFGSLSTFLESDDAQVKLRGHQLAAATGEKPFIDKLVEMYGSTEFEDRLLAVQSIGYSDDSRAGNILSQSLFEARTDIRKAAAVGLAQYANESTLPALKRAMTGERDKQIKLHVVDAVGAVGGQQALNLLRFQVTTNDLELKKRLIEAIRATGMKSGARALDILYNDRNSEVQWRAFLAAMELDRSVATPLFSRVFRNPPAGFLADVDALDPAGRKLIYEYLLTEATGSARDKAAAESMRRGEFDDVIYELATKSSTDTSLRRDIVNHLGNRGTKTDLVILERIARAKNPSLAHLAAWMLTRHPSKSLEASYRGYVASKDDTLKAIAAYGLGTVWR